DVYPDAAERFGELRRGGWLSRLLRAANRWAFARIDAVVALDGAMREVLEQYRPASDGPAFHVIPNWERRRLFPALGERWQRRWSGYDGLDLGDRSVVLYLGNTGVGHRFDTVLEAAAELKDEAVFLFVGGGARW